MKTFIYPSPALNSGPIQFVLDGTNVTVNKDTSVPANSRALPVELTGTAGPINITAGDLNVQLDDIGANFDRTRIGDGSGNQLDMTASNEAKVSDADTHTALTTLLSQTSNLAQETGGNLAAIAASVNSLDGKTTVVDTGSVTIISSTLPTGAATETTLQSIDTKLTAPLSVAVTAPVSDATTSGSIAALNDTVVINTNGYATVSMQATGTWVGSIVIESSVNGTDWSATTLIETSSGIIAVAFSSNIQAQAQCSGFSQIRFRASSWTSGTAILALRANATTSLVMLDNPLPGGTNTIGSIINVSGTVSLPTGASTAAHQVTQNAALVSIDSKLTAPLSVTGPLTDVQLRATPVPISGTITASNPSVSATGAAVPASATMVGGSDGTDLQALKVSSAGVLSVDGSATTQPVSIASSVAVTGPLTDTQLRASAVPVSMTSTTITGSVAVTGPLTDTELRATPVPVSGTVTANAGSGTFAISAAALPLPTGAATESTLSTLNGKVTAVDTGNVTVVSSALPTGAATAANQSTANASLSSIDSKLTSPLAVTGPLTDTQLRASAVPVSLTSTTITGSVAVTGPLTDTQLRASAVPISGTVTANAGTGDFTVTQATGTNLHTVVDSGTVTANIGTTNGLALDASVTGLQVSQGSTTSGQKGALTLGAVTTAAPSYTTAQTSPLSLTTAGALRTDSSAVTQPVSLASVPAATGLTAITFVRNDYSSTSVTTAAYTQLIASTSSIINKLQIFDSSGETLKIAFGAAASEVDKFIVFPGGNGDVDINIPAGTRISIKAISNTASTGELDINAFG